MFSDKANFVLTTMVYDALSTSGRPGWLWRSKRGTNEKGEREKEIKEEREREVGKEGEREGEEEGEGASGGQPSLLHCH